MKHTSLPSRYELAFAFLVVMTASVLTFGLQSFMQRAPFGLFYAAVVISGRNAGKTAGLVAAIFSSLSIIYLLPPPELEFAHNSVGLWQVYVFVCVSLVLNWLVAVPPQTAEMRRFAHRLRITSQDFYDYMTRRTTSPMTPDEIAERILNRLAGEAMGQKSDLVLYSLSKLPLRLDEQERISSIILERGRRHLVGRVAL